MNILARPTDHSGVGCYRVIQPLEQLRIQGGHRAQQLPWTEHQRAPLVEGGPPFTELRVRYDRDCFDGDELLVMQTPGKNELQFIEWARAAGCKIVVELDDYYHGVPKDNRARKALTLPALTALEQAIREADLVTVSTPRLAELYEPWNPRIEVLENRVKWESWAPIQPQYEAQRKRLRVGWVGNSAWHEDAVRIMRGVIGPWLQRNPDVDFLVAGDVPAVHDRIGTPAEQALTIGPFHFHVLPLVVAQFDVGLVPLEPSDFNECKSSLKGQEYMAAGIPFIASPTSEYARLIDRWPVGFLARTPDEWRHRLDELVRDSVLRSAMGSNGRSAAYQTSIERHWREWEDAYLMLLEEKAGDKRRRLRSLVAR